MLAKEHSKIRYILAYFFLLYFHMKLATDKLAMPLGNLILWCWELGKRAWDHCNAHTSCISLQKPQEHFQDHVSWHVSQKCPNSIETIPECLLCATSSPQRGLWKHELERCHATIQTEAVWKKTAVHQVCIYYFSSCNSETLQMEKSY